MDSIFGFVKGFLGIPGENRRNRDDSPQGPPENEFRNPIWNMDDDDDDDDFREHVPNSPFGFQIFSNPLEIHRFFEHQMQEMMKQLQIFDTPSLFGEGNVPALPPPESVPEENRSLRDKFLKPEYRAPLGEAPAPGYHKNKITDSDLDDRQGERVNAGELDLILKDKPSLEEPSTSVIPSSPGTIRSFGKTVSKKIIRLPDGRVEHHQTMRDSSGSEETSITRQLGDKSYTVTTRIGADGTKQQTESLFNMDESELAEFKKKWSSVQGTPSSDIEPKPHNWFPFDKFFK